MTFIPPYVSPPISDPNATRKRGTVQQSYGTNLANLNYQQFQQGQQHAADFSQLTRKYAQMREQMPGAWAQRGILNSGIKNQQLGEFYKDRTYDVSSLARQQQGQQQQIQFQKANNFNQRNNQLVDIDWAEQRARAQVAAQLRQVY